MKELRECKWCNAQFAVESWARTSCCSRTCGCHWRESQRPRTPRSARRESLTYTTWRGLRDRCTNPQSTSYQNYGGRGIGICERWRVYENFLNDVGERPSREHTIDRIDNSRGYEPGNVRWATKSQQARNRRSTILSLDQAVEIRRRVVSGESVKSLAAEFGVSGYLIYRIKHNRAWSKELSNAEVKR